MVHALSDENLGALSEALLGRLVRAAAAEPQFIEVDELADSVVELRQELQRLAYAACSCSGPALDRQLARRGVVSELRATSPCSLSIYIPQFPILL